MGWLNQRLDWSQHEHICKVYRGEVSDEVYHAWSTPGRSMRSSTSGSSTAAVCVSTTTAPCPASAVVFTNSPHGMKNMEEDVVLDFLVSCKLAVLHGVVPVRGWDWASFLDCARPLLPYPFEKEDAKDKYGGENVFPGLTGGRSLRAVGEAVFFETSCATDPWGLKAPTRGASETRSSAWRAGSANACLLRSAVTPAGGSSATCLNFNPQFTEVPLPVVADLQRSTGATGQCPLAGRGCCWARVQCWKIYYQRQQPVDAAASEASTSQPTRVTRGASHVGPDVADLLLQSRRVDLDVALAIVLAVELQHGLRVLKVLELDKRNADGLAVLGRHDHVFGHDLRGSGQLSDGARRGKI